ncbi:DUF87 domain-containing protein [Natroniella acetigena]|uniref:ATP-binding protein n=1 Tax=Natroniella acetigena TaxID=52004 RepID=UPI00200B63E4|nr:DUF87 domain-containing protein [Natroniella acetigena]MCK8827043.1 DUF87 domain-containing protein [Natroniella acetigena]
MLLKVQEIPDVADDNYLDKFGTKIGQIVANGFHSLINYIYAKKIKAEILLRKNNDKIELFLDFSDRLKKEELNSILETTNIASLYKFKFIDDFKKNTYKYTYFMKRKKMESKTIKAILDRKEEHEKKRLFKSNMMLSSIQEKIINQIDIPVKYEFLKKLKPQGNFNWSNFIKTLENLDDKSDLLLKFVIKPFDFIGSEDEYMLFEEINRVKKYSSGIRDIVKRNIENKNVLREVLSDEKIQDLYSREAENSLQNLLQEFTQFPTFNFRIEVNSNDQIFAKDMLQNILSSSFENSYVTEICDMNNPPSMEKFGVMNYLFSLNEVKGFFQLPVGNHMTTFKNIRKSTDIKSFNLNKEKNEYRKIKLGTNNVSRNININLDDFNKHAFVCGSTGSGKTTIIMDLLFQAYEKYDVPFLVLEPAKTEYRTMKKIEKSETLKEMAGVEESKLQNDLQIFTLKDADLVPFFINMFEPVENSKIFEHPSLLEEAFQASMDLFPPTPFLVNRALKKLYKESGFIENVITGEKVSSITDMELDKIPDLEKFVEILKEVMDDTDYDKEVKKNLDTVLNVRFSSLLNKPIGEIFNNKITMPSIEELLQKPTIIELEGLNEYQKGLFMMVLMNLIRNYLINNDPFEEDRSHKLQHLIVLEEAHNIVANIPRSSAGTSNPMENAKDMIVNMLAEIRAKGEGIIVADQIPSAVAPEVIKNTNVKVVGKLNSKDDIKAMGNSMLIGKHDMRGLPKMKTGEFLTFKAGWHKSEKIRSRDFKRLVRAKDGREVLKDSEVLAYFNASLKNKLADLLNDLIDDFDFDKFKEEISNLEREGEDFWYFIFLLYLLDKEFDYELTTEMKTGVEDKLLEVKEKNNLLKVVERLITMSDNIYNYKRMSYLLYRYGRIANDDLNKKVRKIVYYIKSFIGADLGSKERVKIINYLKSNFIKQKSEYNLNNLFIKLLFKFQETLIKKIGIKKEINTKQEIDSETIYKVNEVFDELNEYYIKFMERKFTSLEVWEGEFSKINKQLKNIKNKAKPLKELKNKFQIISDELLEKYRFDRNFCEKLLIESQDVLKKYEFENMKDFEKTALAIQEVALESEFEINRNLNYKGELAELKEQFKNKLVRKKRQIDNLIETIEVKQDKFENQIKTRR